MKDNFSQQAGEYAKFRPGYPEQLAAYLSSLVKEKNLAWDCGTGNGQLALQLSLYFGTVYGTDISTEQLDRAEQRDNIIYIEEAAEETDFDDEMFDLITVAQAIHWFDFEEFYAEVDRCLKHAGIFAVIGYGLMKITPAVDQIIEGFYKEVVGPYWDKERKYIDEEYKTIPFPFEEIKSPDFSSTYEWRFDQLLGYLRTWSATQHYSKEKNSDPIEEVKDELKKAWGENTQTVRFNILLRVGKKK